MVFIFSLAAGTVTSPLAIIAAIFRAMVVLSIGMGVMATRLYMKVPQGRAMIINKISTTVVSFSGGVVMPRVWTAEVMDIAETPIPIDHINGEALAAKDGQLIEIQGTVYLTIPQTQDDIIKVAQTYGCGTVNAFAALCDSIQPRVIDSLTDILESATADEIISDRRVFKELLRAELNSRLDGFVISDIVLKELCKRS